MNLYTKMIEKKMWVPTNIAMDVQREMEQMWLDFSEATEEEFYDYMVSASVSLLWVAVNKMFKPTKKKQLELVEEELDFFLWECVNFCKERTISTRFFEENWLDKQTVSDYLAWLDISWENNNYCREAGYVHWLRDVIKLLSVWRTHDD
jgi:hypothetical protein